MWAVSTHDGLTKGGSTAARVEMGPTRFKAFTNSAVGDCWVPAGEIVAVA